MVMNPDDLKTGALLERAGVLDKAANLYRRSITKYRSRLANNKADREAEATVDLATSRMIGLSRQLLLAGRYGHANDIAQELLAIAPNHVMAQAVRAQALMFIGHGK